MASPNKELAKAIRKIRTERFLSLRDIAAYTGMSVSTVARIEAGNDSANINNVFKIAVALGIGDQVREIFERQFGSFRIKVSNHVPRVRSAPEVY